MWHHDVRADRVTTSRRAGLRLDGPMRFIARTGSGHEIAVDTADAGGEDTASSPVELVLVAAGGCMAMDALAILRKMRQEVAGYDVKVVGDRRDEQPRLYTSITMTHRVRGAGLQAANVARALQLSMSRYCPVFAMLSPTVAVHVLYEATDDATGRRTSGEAVLEGAGA